VWVGLPAHQPLDRVTKLYQPRLESICEAPLVAEYNTTEEAHNCVLQNEQYS